MLPVDSDTLWGFCTPSRLAIPRNVFHSFVLKILCKTYQEIRTSKLNLATGKKMAKICRNKNKAVHLHSHFRDVAQSGLEYASGGRVVAGSNPVIPTDWK